MNRAEKTLSRIQRGLSPVSWIKDSNWVLTPRREKLVAVADSQVLVDESPIGSNRGPEVDIYLGSVGLGGVSAAWCAAFVRWCLGGAYGKPKGWIGNYALVKTWAEIAKDSNALVSTPKRGDIGGWVDQSGFGHIFIVISKPVIGVFRTIEGNTNEAGSRSGIGVRKRARTMAFMRSRHRHFFIDPDKLMD